MPRVGACLWAATLALAACAGRGAAPSETPASKASTQASSACPQAAQGPQPATPWREMTLAEYYADVRERAARRGVEVIWVTPPDVRRVRKAELPTTAVAACAR